MLHFKNKHLAGMRETCPLYFAAVFLFAMLTTCTRRFISANGLAGSLSLLLP